MNSDMYIVYSRYKRASKTDVKCSWLNTQVSTLKSTVTMSNLYPP